jgi:membrane-associated protease RseP (regulator of RpoE activity)
VSSNTPEFPTERSSWESTSGYFYPQSREPGPSSREWIISALFFGATFITTTCAGLIYVVGFLGFFRHFSVIARHPSLIAYGLPFSIPLIMILLAHELGHFAACRYYGMRCSPPYFLPVPVSIAGTMGAFIKIKSPFRHKRALFDIGIAGPLAGFILTIPTLWIGFRYSILFPKGTLGHAGLNFGEPLIFRLIGMLALGYSPARHEVGMHPIAIAGWFGLLVTGINLLPIWQLDGGHVAYAIANRSGHRALSIMAVAFLILVAILTWQIPYLFISALLLIIGIRLHFYHPPTLRDDDSLGIGRWFLGLFALIILVVSFMPVPFSFS